jgi:hypothetical protein
VPAAVAPRAMRNASRRESGPISPLRMLPPACVAETTPPSPPWPPDPRNTPPNPGQRTRPVIFREALRGGKGVSFPRHRLSLSLASTSYLASAYLPASVSSVSSTSVPMPFLCCVMPDVRSSCCSRVHLRPRAAYRPRTSSPEPPALAIRGGLRAAAVEFVTAKPVPSPSASAATFS